MVEGPAERAARAGDLSNALLFHSFGLALCACTGRFLCSSAKSFRGREVSGI